MREIIIVSKIERRNDDYFYENLESYIISTKNIFKQIIKLLNMKHEAEDQLMKEKKKI